MSKVKGQLSNVKPGFSILEVIISTVVLTVGIVGAISLISSSLRHSMDSRDHVIASGLAQEGIEIARHIRDNSWARGEDTFNVFPDSIINNCRLVYDIIYDASANLVECGTGLTHKKLYYKSGFYTHDNTSPAVSTKFQRKIIFSYYDDIGGQLPSPAGAVKAKIGSVVIWSRTDNDFPATCNVSNKCVYMEDILMDWK